MGSLFQELKRRHVFRVAAAYVIVAWVIIQVAGAISAPMSLPEWFESVVIAFLILGFPIALVFAWAFDLNPTPPIASNQEQSVDVATPSAGHASVLRGVAILIVGVLVVSGIYWQMGADRRRALTEGIAELDGYINAADWESAYLKAKDLQNIIPESIELQERWQNFSWATSLVTEPAGAEIYRRDYRSSDEEWEFLGTTPLENVKVPFGYSVIKAELDGYEQATRVFGRYLINTPLITEPIRLDAIGTVPEGMIRIPSWTTRINGEPYQPADYYLGKYEVRNEEYREFVNAGGYERQDFWEYPIMQGDSEISWESAMALFVDQTGQPGPSTWFAGSFPEGQADHPVGGISWYEAAAFARFKGQQLPTTRHWQRALRVSIAGVTNPLPVIIPASNFSGIDTVPVGSTNTPALFGNFDMAGNVREWTMNSIGSNRFSSGAAWNDEPWRASNMDINQPPINRDSGNGVRLAIIRDNAEVHAAIHAPYPDLELPDVSDLADISDETFEAYQLNYRIGNPPFNESVGVLESRQGIRHQLVEIDASYPGLRLPIHLYLPENVSPPYQVVLYAPGSSVQNLLDFNDYQHKLDFILNSGRAIAFPVIYGAFGRELSQTSGASDIQAMRNRVFREVHDVIRTLDYLETRPDIDATKIGFFGNSWGGELGIIAGAIDDRIQSLVLYTPGIALQPGRPRDTNAISFIPRVTEPVLMIVGEYDIAIPLRDVAEPSFDLFGTPEEDKRLVAAPGEHFVPYDLVIRESLDWFNRYLGPPARRN